jgi:uncharacterized protein (TIGR02246 family)
MRGPDQIQKALEEEFAGPAKGAQHETKVVETRSLTPDIAVSHGTFHLTGMRGPEGQPASIHGTYLGVFRRVGGEWRIEALQGAVPSGPQQAPGDDQR